MGYMSLQNNIPTEKPAWSGSDLTDNPHAACDKARRVEEMFTSIARDYDLNNRVHSMWRDQVWRKRAVELACPQLSDEVVDVACGTGDLSMAFHNAGVKSVVGIDFTQAMLDLAIIKAQKAQLPIQYKQGDAMELELSDNCADIVSIAFGLRNVQEPAKAIAEFYRVLRPGGRVIILEFSTPKNLFLRAFNNIYTKRIMPLTATLISRDKSGAYKYLPKSVETFAKPAEIALELQKVGFDAVVQKSQTCGVCTITRAIKH